MVAAAEGIVAESRLVLGRSSIEEVVIVGDMLLRRRWWSSRQLHLCGGCEDNDVPGELDAVPASRPDAGGRDGGGAGTDGAALRREDWRRADVGPTALSDGGEEPGCCGGGGRTDEALPALGNAEEPGGGGRRCPRPDVDGTSGD